MKHARARWAMGIAVATTMLAATPAFASGGSGGGGGGGGGGGTTTTDSKSAPCVQIGNLSTSADQSVVTDGAFVSEAATLSRCGGNNPSFTVVLSAVDAAGNQL